MSLAMQASYTPQAAALRNQLHIRTDGNWVQKIEL
jgi:hypothetical protein